MPSMEKSLEYVLAARLPWNTLSPTPREPASLRVSTSPIRTTVENSVASRTMASAAVAPPFIARATTSPAISRKSTSARLLISVLADIRFLTSCSAHGHFVEFDGGNTHSYRDGLSVFSAGAYAFIQLQIVANHGYFGEGVRSIANQSAILQRRGNLPVLNHVGFRRREDEFPAGNVHLTATEIDGINSTMNGPDNVLWSLVTRKHVCVCHTRHGDVLVAFPAAITGIRDAHQFGRELVTEVALENSFFDQHRVLGGRTLVVNVD